jgi:hypothetical protein
MIGVIAAVVVWFKINDSYEPSPVAPILVMLLAQIALYFSLSNFVLRIKDPVRKKLWTLIMLITGLLIPSLIMYMLVN